MIDSNILESKPDELIINEEKWTNVQVDSQVLSTFMSCARKADYVFNRHLVPISGVPKGVEKGLLAHKGNQVYWRARIDGKDYQVSAKEGIEAAQKYAPTLLNLSADDCLNVFETLVIFFKHIQSLSWQPIFVEQHFKFIAYEDPILKLRIILTGRIDLGFRTPDQKIIPVDLKSESERWFHTQMSNQFKIYCLACKSNVLGVQRFGFQKTLSPEEKFKMELLPFDPDYLDEFKNEVLPYWCKQLLLCKEENYWPPNYASCIHGHFGCQFSDKYNKGFCNISRKVREQKLNQYFTIGEPWEPAEF